ncbi:hypothetical protein GGG16DRAFT_113728 [Schizophyllum commune]
MPAPQQNSQHWKTRLHNLTRGNGWPDATPEYYQGGNSSRPVWLCIIRYQGAECGRGEAQAKALAYELAAERAYYEFRRMMGQ